MDIIDMLRSGHPGDLPLMPAEIRAEAANEIERLRAYARLLNDELSHAVACCSAFQSGGQFNHLARLGEPIFDAVPRLVAQLSN